MVFYRCDFVPRLVCIRHARGVKPNFSISKRHYRGRSLQHNNASIGGVNLHPSRYCAFVIICPLLNKPNGAEGRGRAGIATGRPRGGYCDRPPSVYMLCTECTRISRDSDLLSFRTGGVLKRNGGGGGGLAAFANV